MEGYILLAEDDVALRETLAAALAHRGYEVRTAGDGAQALALAQQQLPTVVVADLEMPVMNGRVMLQQLRATPLGADVPVLVLSGFGYEWEAELVGASACLRKPATAETVDRAIRTLVAAATADRSATPLH